MIFSNLVNYARGRVQKRARYGKLVDEINGLSNRDLVDIGGDRGEMLRHAYLEVYGK